MHLRIDGGSGTFKGADTKRSYGCANTNRSVKLTLVTTQVYIGLEAAASHVYHPDVSYGSCTCPAGLHASSQLSPSVHRSECRVRAEAGEDDVCVLVSHAAPLVAPH